LVYDRRQIPRNCLHDRHPREFRSDVVSGASLEPRKGLFPTSIATVEARMLPWAPPGGISAGVFTYSRPDFGSGVTRLVFLPFDCGSPDPERPVAPPIHSLKRL